MTAIETQQALAILFVLGLGLSFLVRQYGERKFEEGSSFIHCPKCFIRMNGKNHQPYMYDDDNMVVYSCSCGCKSRWDLDAPCPLLLWSSQ